MPWLLLVPSEVLVTLNSQMVFASWQRSSFYFDSSAYSLDICFSFEIDCLVSEGRDTLGGSTQTDRLFRFSDVPGHCAKLAQSHEVKLLVSTIPQMWYWRVGEVKIASLSLHRVDKESLEAHVLNCLWSLPGGPVGRCS